MTHLLTRPRALDGELLPPDVEVPEEVRLPRVREIIRFDHDMTIGVKLGDGGRWKFSEGALRKCAVAPRQVDGEVIQYLFEEREMRFHGRGKP